MTYTASASSYSCSASPAMSVRGSRLPRAFPCGSKARKRGEWLLVRPLHRCLDPTCPEALPCRSWTSRSARTKDGARPATSPMRSSLAPPSVASATSMRNKWPPCRRSQKAHTASALVATIPTSRRRTGMRASNAIEPSWNGPRPAGTGTAFRATGPTTRGPPLTRPARPSATASLAGCCGRAPHAIAIARPVTAPTETREPGRTPRAGAAT
jgi:hypothetical protein